MLPFNGLKQSLRPSRPTSFIATAACRRLHYDGRNRLSTFWTPLKSKPNSASEDGHDLLVRAGFLRQAHSGIFHLLPLGLRVQEKIERLVDKHMRSLGASKLSMSSLSSEELWQRSGRLDKGRGSEFLRLEDRKGTKLLLSPTHEEEVTTVVANAVHSYKKLPLRLYQVSRKYRDEARPRQGLLRGREFVMKDLYTFDTTDSAARSTYEAVRKAYCAFLDELRLPYLVASADSGNMGGNLSHEYHFASESGEDIVLECDTCDYSANEELYIGRPLETAHEESDATVESQSSYLVKKDHRHLIVLIHPTGHDINIHAIKKLVPDVDTSVNDALEAWQRADNETFMEDRHITFIHDPSLPPTQTNQPQVTPSLAHKLKVSTSTLTPTINGSPALLTKATPRDPCPACASGHLSLHPAVEIGHTFHLGTRYSEPLNLRVTDELNKQVPVHMGCHGIGVSRLIGAAAALLADEKGLNWPLAIAPFGVVIIPISTSAKGTVPGVLDDQAGELYDLLSQAGLDPVLDDRDLLAGWKLNEADTIGYPFVVVRGRAWGEKRAVELQCRRLGVKEEVRAEDLVARMKELSAKL